MRVSAATAARVRKIADEAGYRTNLAARAVRTGTFGALGLLLSTAHSRSILSGTLLDALLERTAHHGLHLTVAQLPDEQLSQGITPRIFTEWLVDGLIINYNTDIPKPLLDLLSRGDVPSVWINTKQPADCLYPDDFQGAQSATETLIELGHKAISFAIYTGWGHYSTHDRCAGYCAAMGKAGLKPEILTLYTSDEAHLQHAKERLSERDRPTAVICYADKTLRPVLKAAHLLGLRIPEDLSVITFGDEQASDVDLIIATMRLPLREIGHGAVDMLLKRLKKPVEHFPPIVLPFKLMEGHSVAPPGR